MPGEAVSKTDPDVQIVKTKTKPRCAVNMRKLVERNREPHEIPSRALAIYNQCRHCRGWEGDGRSLAAEVAACPNRTCELWEARCKNPSEKSLYRPSGKIGPKVATKNSDPGISTEKGVKPSSTAILRRSFDRSRMITDFCASCHCLKPGESRNPIRRCSSPECWLYPYRTGKLDVETFEPETLDDLERRVDTESKERGEK